MSYILASNKEMLRLAAIAYVLLTRTQGRLTRTQVLLQRISCLKRSLRWLAFNRVFLMPHPYKGPLEHEHNGLECGSIGIQSPGSCCTMGIIQSSINKTGAMPAASHLSTSTRGQNLRSPAKAVTNSYGNLQLP